MKIVQSYWSIPSRPRLRSGRTVGGWPDLQHHLFSWALSAHLLRRFYDEVELVTDNEGKYLLIDILKLPYTQVSTALESLDQFPARFWAAGKIKAYSLQQEPFIHVDGDVYIWRPLEDYFEKLNLIAQSRLLFRDYPFSEQVRSAVHHQLVEVPQAILSGWQQPDRISWINAGIIGGTDLDFFADYCREALQFMEANRRQAEIMDSQLLNMIFEEHLFYCLAAERQKEVKVLCDNIDASFSQVLKFHLLPRIKSYVHAAGSAKQNLYACEQIRLRLQREFPAVYERILVRLPQIMADHRLSGYWQLAPGSSGKKKVPTIADPYVRTRQLSTYFDLPVPKKGDYLQAPLPLAPTDQPGCDYIEAVFQLETLRQRLEARTPKKRSPERRGQSMAGYYELLETSPDQLLDELIVLNPEVEISQCKWYLPPGCKLDQSLAITKVLTSDCRVLLYPHPFEDRWEELVLEGWDELLMAFTVPTNIRSIIAQFRADPDRTKAEISAIKNRIIDLVMSHLIYTGILEREQSKEVIADQCQPELAQLV